MNKTKVMTVIGARPQFVKAAVVSAAFEKQGKVYEIIVHTGQHYDEKLSDVFFKELDIKKPKYNLDVGSHAASKQLGIMLEKLDEAILKEKPDVILAYGDTNSTLAAAICACYRNVPFVHAEAGERIYRRIDVPEEFNRVIADHGAYLCLTSTTRASDYLIREGMNPERIKFAGDVMYELFLIATTKLKSRIKNPIKMKKGSYHVATIHRAENTNDKQRCIDILSALDSSKKPVVLPAHPRLSNLLKQWKWKPKKNLKLIEPLGYFEFLGLLLDCDKCITDSGGVTREAFFAKKPCIIPMKNSWWVDVIESKWAIETPSSKEISYAIENFKAPSYYPKGLFGQGDSGKIIAESVIGILKKEGKWQSLGSYDELPKSGRRWIFTLKEYEDILKKLKQNYRFASFQEAQTLLEKRKSFVIMRHDIDLELDAALEMAKIEKKHGVVSTYFFMLSTEHYNLFSPKGTKTVNKILDMGHHLGLHFDCACYDPKFISLECSKESQILENHFGRKVEIISFHRPDAIVLSGDAKISNPRPHTYMPLFSKRMKYFSDSGGTWKFANPMESEEFKRKEPLHILIHPIWWNENSTSSFETLMKLVDKKKKDFEISVAKNCKVFRVGRLSSINDEKFR